MISSQLIKNKLLFFMLNSGTDFLTRHVELYLNNSHLKKNMKQKLRSALLFLLVISAITDAQLSPGI